MNAIRAFAALLLTGVLAGALPACAQECVPTVREGWVRLPPVAAMPMMAGFGRIENRCGAELAIVGATSPAFGDVSLHETRVVEGVSRMRALPELRIAPGSAAVLEPGGMHLMLMQPREPLKPGSTIVVDFLLKEGGTLRGQFAVRTPID